MPAPVDLLVFGPHPDDIEIGVGGTVARHAAEGHRVGLCDLTRAELSTNGTPEERQAEAAAAAHVLGAAVARQSGLARWRHRRHAEPRSARPSSSFDRRGRERLRVPYWDDRHPDHVAASQVLRTAAFRSGLRRYVTESEAWHAGWICYYFINDSATAVVRRRRHRPLPPETRGARLLSQSVRTVRRRRRRHATEQRPRSGS